MKLMFCTLCMDVLALRKTYRICSCGASSGMYMDDQRATLGGHAIPIGFANSSFLSAVRHRERKTSTTFEAFVIEYDCPTVTEGGV